MKALIALEDGTVFSGRAFAGSGEVSGELVFNTSMTGYQEIVTDPSYHGQIVTMTYPLIGYYGINPEDCESRRIFASGLVVHECSRLVSNWRADKSLPQYLEESGIMGIEGIDTRAVTLRIRNEGAMKCVVSTTDPDPDSLIEKARQSPGLVGRDLSSEVSVDEAYEWPCNDPQCRLAVLDCGIKTNQLRLFEALGCACKVYPNNTAAADILADKPDGFFISNGPGDPAGVPQVVEIVRAMIDSGIPTFGICFGHQLIALALGARTYKLKFGHRGANHPIKNLLTGKIEIASHNHGFCVDADSLDPELIEVTHINLNDNTVAGLRHKQLPVACVQYHPEASPGPSDPFYLFQEFIERLKR